MTQTVNSSLFLRRQQKLTQLRSTLCTIPLLKQKSQKLQNKYELSVKQQSHAASSNYSSNDQISQTESVSALQSEQEQSNGYNSFLEKYELLEKLGEGGNACVYKCIYKPNGRYYAAKKFRIQEEHVQQLKKNFINMKELNHASLCKYRALYFDQNLRFTFLVMEYLPFPSLADYEIKSQEQLKYIVKQIITAITYIHNRNMCHRDIKPQNILYNQQQKKIKIIDFGISKKTYLRGVRRDMLTIIGTHYYLAPEVYLGGGYDQRIDLWALGVTIYKLISGYTPFESQYHSDTVANILKGQVVYDDQIWRQYSPFARYFVSRLLKNSEERMTLDQATHHLWLQNDDAKKRKLSRMFTHDIHLNEKFHREVHHNIRHANSKQQGSANTQDDKKLYRSINIINVMQYELQDSEDQFSVVTPKTAGYGKSAAQMKLFQSFSDFSSFANQMNKQFC